MINDQEWVLGVKMFKRLKKFRTQFAKDTRGAASVEFVIIAPVYFALMFSTFEAGWLMTKSMMLERGLDITIRDLRLGRHPNPTHDQFKQIICDHTGIVKNCTSSMLLELTPIANATDIPTSTVCRDRSNPIEPVVTFNPGAESEIIFVRACVIVDPMIPGMGLGLHLPLDATGGMALASYAAFNNEPE